MTNPNKIVKNILGDKHSKNYTDSTPFYRRVHEDGYVGICEMCGKKGKLYDDLCKKCRINK